MPHLTIQSLDDGGRVHVNSFAYTISTPTDPFATEIIQTLPTIVLIHPVYAAAAMLHPIFADRHLRRFNIVVMDLRGHGETKADVDDNYGRAVLAADVLKITEQLKIPTFHVVGIATGGSVALELAILAPERVRSVFVISPAPQVEPVESIQGRQEIADLWNQAHRTDSTEIDEIAAADAIYGALQLMYSNIETPLTKAFTSYGVSKARLNWTGENLHLINTVTVDFFLNQHPFTASPSSLKRIRAPVMLIHCSEDIVYPHSDARELLELLLEADVDARLAVLEGAPHWGWVTHPEETNALLYDFIMSNCELDASKLPPPPDSVESPFLEELARHGFVEDESDVDLE
ncbi:AB hydrolase-1 domain-containing protein [Favolaschia claudopus]|uniref:AB hydrolase-1 domain-containing protein n=1 Tax=Favolaschia claudopus TaxID=2862362 RepID=A0AAW0CW70_9AGAR